MLDGHAGATRFVDGGRHSDRAASSILRSALQAGQGRAT
ncbi:hypothetical protein FM110_06620 [Brachybacterium nesterenkovii]|uniref:Uncharacterized protein n=1 Tax=Brachybacterium nesterenkovii TaxID=47847 RepID=A0A1X6WZW1_9MICO|nr:hypothetical protein FM110_06620 [Brachybacterium nesterenkovii]